MTLNPESSINPITEIPSDDPLYLATGDFLIETGQINSVSTNYVLNWSNRISGIVIGPKNEVDKISRFLQEDAPVPSRTFCNHIKKVRTVIFSTKQRLTTGTRGGR